MRKTRPGAAGQGTCREARTAAPGILQTRKTYDQAGRCIEFARDIYRADRAAFEFDAIVQPPALTQTQEIAARA